MTVTVGEEASAETPLLHRSTSGPLIPEQTKQRKSRQRRQKWKWERECAGGWEEEEEEEEGGESAKEGQQEEGCGSGLQVKVRLPVLRKKQTTARESCCYNCLTGRLTNLIICPCVNDCTFSVCACEVLCDVTCYFFYF